MYSVWSSRDLTLVIVLAVAGFVFTAVVGQIAHMITGIPGVNYLFTIGNAILISAAFLLFEGRRWRFMLNNTLFALLTLPTFMVSAPFDLMPRIAIILNGIQADIVLNSFYGRFERKNKLIWWSILCSLVTVLVSPILFILIYSFYLPNYAAVLGSIVFLLLPVIIIESIAGGYIGYQIYKRVERAAN